MSSPKASVVMSVCNGQDFLKETMDSIISQTFADFEFVIIDDGSTDNTKNIIAGYKDKRITYKYQENQGVLVALNNGVAATNSDIIVRIDSDDVADLDRIRLQVEYLNGHPDCVVVGSNLIFVDEVGEQILKSPMLLGDREIKLEMLVRSPFGHPSVAFRKKQFLESGGYSQDFRAAEDYDLWVRLAALGSFANINQDLLHYRINSAGVSRKSAQAVTDQNAQAKAISNRAWSVIPDQLHKKSLRGILKSYAGNDEISKLQLGRLSDVCLAVTLDAVRRGRFIFAAKVLSIMLSSPAGVYNLLKSIKRKVWR